MGLLVGLQNDEFHEPLNTPIGQGFQDEAGTSDQPFGSLIAGDCVSSSRIMTSIGRVLSSLAAVSLLVIARKAARRSSISEVIDVSGAWGDGGTTDAARREGIRVD